MTTVAAICSTLGEVFRAHGFSGRGRRWKRRVSEVVTIIEIDSPPASRSVAIDVGVWAPIFGGDEPTGVTHSPLLMHMETMELADGVEPLDAARSFDLRSEMSDEERLGVVAHMAEALVRHLAKLSSPEALRAAYHRGDLASAAMRADVRALLDGGSDIEG